MSGEKEGTSSTTEEEAQKAKDLEIETKQKAEEEAKKASAEDTAKNEEGSENSDEKGDKEELTEAEIVRREADSKISKMSNKVKEYQQVVLKDLKSNPVKLYDLYESDKDLALQIAEENPELVEEAIAAQDKLLEVDKDEDGEDKPLSKKDLEAWYSERSKKEKGDSIKGDLQARQVGAIVDFLTKHPEITKGSELETKIFDRFKVYTKESSTPTEIATILEDSLQLSNIGSYEAGEAAATLKGAANAAASSSVGGKGGSVKTQVKLTDTQRKFCDKHKMDYAEYAKHI